MAKLIDAIEVLDCSRIAAQAHRVQCGLGAGAVLRGGAAEGAEPRPPPLHHDIATEDREGAVHPRLLRQQRDAGGLLKEIQFTVMTARALRQGVLDVVLVTDAAGVATNCKLMVTTSYADLDASMCQTLMKQRFEPARGADGQPVASFWRTRITLRVG
jgi:outer membrane biosynthesis protein TonB